MSDLDVLINNRLDILNKLKEINNNKFNENFKNLKKQYVKLHLKIKYITDETYRNNKKYYQKEHYNINKEYKQLI